MRAVNQIMNTLYFVFSAEHSIHFFQMNLKFKFPPNDFANTAFRFINSCDWNVLDISKMNTHKYKRLALTVQRIHNSNDDKFVELFSNVQNRNDAIY